MVNGGERTVKGGERTVKGGETQAKDGDSLSSIFELTHRIRHSAAEPVRSALETTNDFRNIKNGAESQDS